MVKGDREFVLAAVKRDGQQLKNASKELKGDHEIVLAAVKQNGLALVYASEELKANHEIVLAAVNNHWWALGYASREFKDDREIVLAAVKKDGSVLDYASKELKADRDIVLTAVKQNHEALFFASEKLMGDREIVLAAVKQNGYALDYASDELRGDREILLAAVKQNGLALEYASKELRGDHEIVLAAVKQDVVAFEYASKELRGDREFVLAVVKEHGEALWFASEELKGDREIVLAAVNQHGTALAHASNESNANHEIVLAAVKQDGMALTHASKELRGHREITLTAVKQHGTALQYASNEFKDDREIVLAAVKQNGLALEHASEELRGDREIVLAALKQDGNALEYASEELRGDREILLAAVKQNGLALEYASEELRGDHEIALAAVKQNFQALKFITLEATSCWADEVLLIVTNALHDTEEHEEEEEEEEDSSDEEEEDENEEEEGYSISSDGEPTNSEVLHQWVKMEEMAEKLKLLVNNDPTIADIKNDAGQTAIDLAIPVCKGKMKEGLRLFGKYEVEDGAWEHLSPTACVIRVNYFGEGDGNNLDPIPMVLKCMSNIEEVKAEIECRKEFRKELFGTKHVMQIEDVYIDSSLGDECKLLQNIRGETGINPEAGLKNFIQNKVKDKVVKRKGASGVESEDGKDREVKDASEVENDYTYRYVLAFPFADRTLDRAMKDDRVKGTPLVKHIVTDIANGILELHEIGRIHGDIKPPNILRDGSTWKLADLDISCPMGEKYGKKTPSTGWCPPEVVDKISKGQLQSYEASIAHDLWAFGAILYKLETGTELFQVDDRDDIVNVKEIHGWSNAAMRRKKLQQVNGQEAKDLLKKLLEYNPKKRLEHFVKDGEGVMVSVLEDGYFSQQTNMLNKLTSIRKGVGRIDEKLDNICLDIAEIKDLTMAQQLELKRTSKVLLHAIYEATGVQTPTTFVILDEPLPDEPEELSACDMIDSYETLSEDVQAQLDKWKGRLDQAKAWIERLANSDIGELMQDVKPEKIIDYINKAASKLVVKETMYFYWIDELTAKPVRAKGFPIPITKPADIVPKLLPYVHVGMCAMSLYCGSAGIARMFGFPVPTVPKEVRGELRASVEVLKQSSSVETFQCVRNKVEANDGETETLRGAELRELEEFVEKEMSHLSNNSKFAGLRRIADEDGSAVWTLISEKEVPTELEKRSERRKREAALAAKEVEEEKEELKQMGNKCNELKSEAEKAKHLAERAAKDLEDLKKTNAEISKKEKEAKADAEDLQKALDKKCCVIC